MTRSMPCCMSKKRAVLVILWESVQHTLLATGLISYVVSVILKCFGPNKHLKEAALVHAEVHVGVIHSQFPTNKTSDSLCDHSCHHSVAAWSSLLGARKATWRPNEPDSKQRLLHLHQVDWMLKRAARC